MSNKIIEVQNIKVNITNIDDNDYICISDFGKYKEGKSKADDIIRNWLRNRITLEFLEHGSLFIIQILIPSNSTGLEKVQGFIHLH